MGNEGGRGRQQRSVRAQPQRNLVLRLAPRQRALAVSVRTRDGEPLADSYVAIAPRSAGHAFHAPLHARADASGNCLFGDPGSGEATVIASAPGFAPAMVDLAASAERVAVVLDRGGALRGRLCAADGSPWADAEVMTAPVAMRSNEPVAPLLARRTRTDAEGRFEFAHLPAGPVVVRVQDVDRTPPALPFVLAGTDADICDGSTTEVELVATTPPLLRGRLRAATGAPIAGWHVLGAPQRGTAALRTFHTRSSTTADDGGFVLTGLVAGEPYQLGAYPPVAMQRYREAFPVASGRAAAGDLAVDLVVDDLGSPRARLSLRVMSADGRAVPEIEAELRAMALGLPTTTGPGPDGSILFEGLAPGEYWLALGAPGLGTRTLPIVVPSPARDVDLGVVTILAPALPTLRLDGAGAGRAGLRVIARAMPGDKFVEAATDGRGNARLPAVPPGPVMVLVHGPGIAPLQFETSFASGEAVWLPSSASTWNADETRLSNG
jgi:hypothetical protein